MQCAKITFFLLSGKALEQNIEKPEPCVGCNTIKGKTVFVFMFSYPMNVGLSDIRHPKKGGLREIIMEA